MCLTLPHCASTLTEGETRLPLCAIGSTSLIGALRFCAYRYDHGSSSVKPGFAEHGRARGSLSSHPLSVEPAVVEPHQLHFVAPLP